jgi:Resolvase, N terminal domain/Helix-turn-helix domain of resolvase
MMVWQFDRWGRSRADLIVTLKALHELGMGFVSLTEAFELTMPSGRAMAEMPGVLAEFERDIIRERVKAGLAQARAVGRILGRPPSAATKEQAVKQLFAKGLSQAKIARRVGIGRTSVRRILTYGTSPCPILTRISAVPVDEVQRAKERIVGGCEKLFFRVGWLRLPIDAAPTPSGPFFGESLPSLLRRKSADSIMARGPMMPSDVQAGYMRSVGCFLPSKKLALANGRGSIYVIRP